MEMPPKHVRFTHTPLNFKNEEVRLLTIEPSVEPSSPIQVTMKHVDLSRHFAALVRYREEVARNRAGLEQGMAMQDEFLQGMFDFTALSYTWGPESPAQDILVTSADCRGWFSIRQNLFEFLTNRRNSSSAWFWIDQVCINQGKDDEKAHQVNQMTDIYSAATVEVWLGCGFEGSDALVDLIFHESTLSSHQGSCVKLSLTKREMRAIIPSMRRLLQISYWSRLWIVQEIVLGRIINMRIGSKTISGDAFFSGWERLSRARSHPDVRVDDNLRGGLRENNVDIRISWIGSQRRTISSTFYTLGLVVWGSECSDLRDSVYGAMGMIRPSLRIFPDYSLQPQEILLILLTREAEGYRTGSQGWLPRDDFVNTASQWFSQLGGYKNGINPRSVRRHLFELIPVWPPKFHCEHRKAWQLKLFLWWSIPNHRSMLWRFARVGTVPIYYVPVFIKYGIKAFKTTVPDILFADSDST